MSHEGKRWISAQELLEDALRLAARVLASGFQPEIVVGLWRGGAPVAVALHEALLFRGVHAAHLPLRTRLYTAVDARAAELEIDGLEQLVPLLAARTRVLLVDDVWDTGITLCGVMDAIARLPGGHRDTRAATVWFKPGRNRASRTPDYHLNESDEWLVFPHELEGLSVGELRAHRGKSFVDALLGADPA